MLKQVSGTFRDPMPGWKFLQSDFVYQNPEAELCPMLFTASILRYPSMRLSISGSSSSSNMVSAFTIFQNRCCMFLYATCPESISGTFTFSVINERDVSFQFLFNSLHNMPPSEYGKRWNCFRCTRLLPAPFSIFLIPACHCIFSPSIFSNMACSYNACVHPGYSLYWSAICFSVIKYKRILRQDSQLIVYEF